MFQSQVITGGYINLTARFHYEGDKEKNDAMILRCYKEDFNMIWISHDYELATMQVLCRNLPLYLFYMLEQTVHIYYPSNATKVDKVVPSAPDILLQNWHFYARYLKWYHTSPV